MKPEVIDSFTDIWPGSPERHPAAGLRSAESKFHPPRVRPGIVVRTALVERLAAARVPVITVVAPPGYGKTTLMAQWAERIGPRVAWLSCDEADNDPVVLLSALAVALDRIEPVDPAIFWALASSGAGITAAPVRVRRRRGAAAGHAAARPRRGGHEQAVPEHHHRVRPAPAAGLAARAWPRAAAVPLPTARLRAQGGILEITAADLAMRPGGSILARCRGAGVEAGEAGIPDLLQRTEGWPAGLYLAALAIKAGSRQSEVGFTFTGDDRFMGDYLRSELLGPVSAEEASFLTRTSVLDRMCGPLCDAILGETGIRGVLEHMEARNLLVVPLDRRREWYRYHHLLRDLLQAELRRREPDLVQDLHFRAAAWYEANAHAGGGDRARPRGGRLRPGGPADPGLQQPVWASGRVETVLRWMEWLRDVTAAEHYRRDRGARRPDLRAARPAERSRALGRRRGTRVPGGILPDGSTMAGHAGLPARAPVPRRHRRDAARRADRLGGAKPGEPVPGHDAVHRGRCRPAGG